MFTIEQATDSRPHEMLGLPADERDPVRIVEAAAGRLRALEHANGSEIEVRRSLGTLLRRARDEMLGRLRNP